MKKLRLFIAGAFVLGALASCEKEEVTTNDTDQSTNPGTKNMVSNGSGGSLAQFTIVDDYLYTIDYRTLKIFYLGDPDYPALTESIDMGVGMETVFHENGKLFIGSTSGVNIYDITDPRSPQEVSQFEHVTSCDPVVANDNIAIATLRGGTECGGSLSQMDVLDISDIYNPLLIGQVDLGNPYGLGFSNVDANIVYVCDGIDGLKAFDVSNPAEPALLMTHTTLEALDVIADGPDNLIVLTRAGIYQFDASKPAALDEISFISVQ
jgi:hypothetical protein